MDLDDKREKDNLGSFLQSCLVV